MATIVAKEKPAMLNMMGKAFNGIFDNPPDIFMRVRALDVLFDGFLINCDRTEFAPKAVCTAVKKEAPSGLVIGPNNQFRFSIFGGVSMDTILYKSKLLINNTTICSLILEKWYSRPTCF